MSEEENDTQWELAAWEMLAEAKEQLKAERALADLLAKAIQKYLVLGENIDATTDELNDSWEHLQSSLSAWKEARSE